MSQILKNNMNQQYNFGQLSGTKIRKTYTDYIEVIILTIIQKRGENYGKLQIKRK